MEGFTYTDIFETKGLEYIVIIAFLILLIPFWIIMNKQSKLGKQIHRVLGALTSNILRIPQGLFYCKNHTWTFLEKSGNAKIGLDDFLLQVVGDVKLTPFKFPGDKLRKGEVLAEIDQNGKRLKITSPLSGEILRTNLVIQKNPELLLEDPYDKGWIFAIKPSDWKTDTHSYYLADEATSWVTMELNRFKDFLAVSLGKHTSEPSLIVYQEGGEIRQHILSDLNNEVWEEFQETFLS